MSRHVHRGAGVRALQQESRGGQAVVMHREVQPLEKVGSAGFFDLEHGEHATLDAHILKDLAVVTWAL